MTLPDAVSALEFLEGVFGKARVERTDVEGVVQVDPLRLAALPDPRSGVGCGGRGEILLPRGHLLEHGGYGRMVVLEREKKTGQAPHCPCGSNGLGQRLFAVGNGLAFPCNHDARPFLANLYRIAVLYG